MPAYTQREHVELTNFAVGLTQDFSNSLANVIAPTVVTGIAVGKYKKYDDLQDFLAPETDRPIGGTRRRIEFNSTDPDFSLNPHGLEIHIDDFERDLHRSNDPLGIERAKVRTLVSQARTSFEKEVFDTVSANTTAISGLGSWEASGTADPTDEVNQAILQVINATGLRPTNAIFGLNAWAAFVAHPKTIERQPGAALVAMTAGMASSMFISPLQVDFGSMIAGDVQEGGERSVSQIVGDSVYVFFSSPAPDTFDPSFMKNFQVDGSGISAVRTYRDDSRNSDVLALDWANKVIVTSNLTVARIDVTS